MFKSRPGFSVVEVLAAVALISIAIIPLYQWQRALADSAFRLERSAEVLDAEENALALLATINPAEAPTGSLRIGEWSLSWTSHQLAFEPDAEGFLGQSNYAIGLYEMTLTLQRDDYQREMTVRQMGWTLIRNPLAEFGG